MPDICGNFQYRATDAVALTQAIEQVKANLPPARQSLLHHYRLQLIYELAYLRMFCNWEEFLEQTFLRYLCGYECSAGPETPLLTFTSSISRAENLVLAGHQFVLWHNPGTVIRRAQTYFRNSRHEQVIASNLTRIESFSHIRHRIAHHNADAKAKFDTACMMLCGRRFPGSRPGAFLRDWVNLGATRRRWLDVIANELCNLAQQIVP